MSMIYLRTDFDLEAAALQVAKDEYVRGSITLERFEQKVENILVHGDAFPTLAPRWATGSLTTR